MSIAFLSTFSLVHAADNKPVKKPANKAETSKQAKNTTPAKSSVAPSMAFLEYLAELEKTEAGWLGPTDLEATESQAKKPTITKKQQQENEK